MTAQAAKRSNNIVVHRPLRESALELLRVEALLTEALKRKNLRPIAGGVAGAWTFTDIGKTRLVDGGFDLDTDTFLIALYLSTSNIGAASTTSCGVIVGRRRSVSAWLVYPMRCRKARKHGYQLWCDFDLTYQVRHIGLAEIPCCDPLTLTRDAKMQLIAAGFRLPTPDDATAAEAPKEAAEYER